MRQIILVTACIAAMLLGGCKYRSGAAQTATTVGTITAPKGPKPSPANSDDALTQTVDIEDGRSEAEGGALTEKANVNTDTAVAGTRKSSVTKPKAQVRKQK